MFLLGHSVWGYLFIRLTGRKFRTSIPLPIALLVGIVPDFDLIFLPLSLSHHTYTHSLVLLGPITILLILILKQKGLLISIGILSHLFTDAIVGTIPILYPFSLIDVGLGLPLAFDAYLEVGILPFVLLYALRNGDIKSIVTGDSKNIWILVPLVTIVSISLLFAQDNNIYLPAFAFSRKALTVITLGHYLLGIVMSAAVILALVTWIKDKQRSRNTK